VATKGRRDDVEEALAAWGARIEAARRRAAAARVRAEQAFERISHAEHTAIRARLIASTAATCRGHPPSTPANGLGQPA
jgi:hypothetical protein